MKQSKQKRTIVTTWETATYDVWGNAKDGYEVNDVYRGSEVELRLTLQVNNAGTAHEFISASPSDRQLKRVFGVGCRIDTDGDDMHVTVNRERDGYPIGELRCISHESLSPVREFKGKGE